MRDRPNLLFLYTDEQVAASMAAYGNTLIDTPHLDALAADSVLFENAYVTQPVCTPSRSSLLTGLYPHSSGCVRNNVPLALDVPCLAEMGDLSGYATGHFGKWHLGDEVFAQHGFRAWASIEDMYRPHYRPGRDVDRRSTYGDFLLERGYEPDASYPDGFRHFSRGHSATFPEEVSKPAFVADQTIAFIEGHRDRPFVAYANFLEPHFPLHGPRDGQYDPATVPLPPNYGRPPTPDQALKARLLHLGIKAWGFESDAMSTDDDWRAGIARYWGLVSLVDTHVGRILAALEANGLVDDTIVVFTSDHGDFLGGHQLMGKCLMFEEALRVPMLLRVPGITAAGHRVAAPVSHIDVVPTLLEAMGQAGPPALQGTSWLPTLRGEVKSPAQHVFVEWNGADGWGHAVKRGRTLDAQRAIASEERILQAMRGDPARAVITAEGWKLICWRSGHREMYNLAEDPGETANLAGRAEHRAVQEHLAGLIRRWQVETDDALTLPLS